eukprot:scaffold86310_cov31-Tisochrysis_lutea.AAC.1
MLGNCSSLKTASSTARVLASMCQRGAERPVLSPAGSADVICTMGEGARSRSRAACAGSR